MCVFDGPKPESLEENAFTREACTITEAEALQIVEDVFDDLQEQPLSRSETNAVYADIFEHLEKLDPCNE